MAESLNNQTFTVKENEEQLVKFSFTKDVIDPDRRDQILNTNLNLFVPNGNILFNKEVIFDLNQNTGTINFENEGEGPVFLTLESSHPDDVSVGIIEAEKIKGKTIPPSVTSKNVEIDLVSTDAFLDRNDVKLIATVQNNIFSPYTKEISLKSTPSVTVTNLAQQWQLTNNEDLAEGGFGNFVPFKLVESTPITIGRLNTEKPHTGLRQRIQLQFSKVDNTDEQVKTEIKVMIPEESRNIISIGDRIRPNNNVLRHYRIGENESLSDELFIWRKTSNGKLVEGDTATFIIQTLVNSRDLEEKEYTILFFDNLEED